MPPGTGRFSLFCIVAARENLTSKNGGRLVESANLGRVGRFQDARRCLEYRILARVRDSA